MIISDAIIFDIATPYPSGVDQAYLWSAGDGVLVGHVHIAAITAHQPVTEFPIARVAVDAPNFVADYYDRIQISQGLLALGNVVSSVVQTIGVWNAWRYKSETLNTLNSINASGINVTGPGTLPIIFGVNQMFPWTFTVTTLGSPTIDAFYIWSFASGEVVQLEITGNRITAWALTPDWANGVKETLQFKTDVMQSFWSAKEQRRALRIAPRRIFEFSVDAAQQDRRFIEAALFTWSAMVWALPIWADGQQLTTAANPGDTIVACDTVNRDFVGDGLAILIFSATKYEVLQIDVYSSSSIVLAHPIVGTWPVGSKIYPARTARLNGYPQLTKINGQMASIHPSFTVIEPCDWTAASGLPAYRSNPVLENSPNDADSNTQSYERQAVTIDNQTGAIEVIDNANIGFSLRSHAWFLQGRSQRAAFRALMYLLKGRVGEMWVPTYNSDLKLVSPIAPTDTGIVVETTGYTLFLVNQLNRKDIRIELTSGTIFYRRITGASIVDANTESLSIDSSLGQAIAVAQIRRISYMAMSRLNTDSIDIMHHTKDDGVASAVTPFRALNHDL